MPPDPSDPKTDLAYLWDMHEWAKTVRELVEGRTFEEYQSNKMLRLAVERAIEVIGEAARKVSVERKEKHAQIPWRLIVGQRHVLAHDYGEIKHEKIWRVATKHIPDLIGLIEPILKAEPPT